MVVVVGGCIHTAVLHLLSPVDRCCQSEALLMVQICVVSAGPQNQITGLRDKEQERRGGSGAEHAAMGKRAGELTGPFSAAPDRKHKSADVEQLGDIRTLPGKYTLVKYGTDFTPRSLGP